MDSSRARRIAENESLFREINAHIQEAARRFEPRGATGQDFLCECGRTSCFERVWMAMQEYELVRANPRRFFVVPGHEQPEVEVVIEVRDQYAVVEKIGGGAAVAEQLAAELGRRRDPPADGAS